MQRLQSEAREACIAELRGLGDTAIGVIRRILEDDEAPASARLNAAFRLLDLIGVVPGCFSAAPAEDKPVRRTLDPETLQRISAEIYGLAD
jgi:hypothetical protein